ncbi:MAG: AI-2E family transporter, partial [Acholeplasmataceae bacterium]
VSILGLYYLQRFSANIMSRLTGAISAVLIPFVTAFFLSFIIGPLARWIEKKTRLKTSISTIIAIFVGILFIIFILVIAVGFIVSQAVDIFRSLTLLIDQGELEVIIREFYDEIRDMIDTDFRALFESLTSNGFSFSRIFELIASGFAFIIALSSNVISVVFTIALTPVFLYYLIKEKEVIFQNLADLIPKKARVHVVELGKRSNRVIQDYFRAQGIMMSLIALYFIVAFSLISFFVPGFTVIHALLFGIALGLFSIIPYLGMWLGLAAPVVFLLTRHLEFADDSDRISVYLIALAAVLISAIVQQLLESSIVQPKVMGMKVKIHPLAVLSSLIFFGGLFGLVGVLLAVPLAGTIKASFRYMNEIFAEEEEPEDAPLVDS